MSFFAMKHSNCPTCRCTDPVNTYDDYAALAAASRELVEAARWWEEVDLFFTHMRNYPGDEAQDTYSDARKENH